jgi:hypothetical protein
MKSAVIICNAVLFAFLCFVLLTDGFPVAIAYIIFTLLSLITPVLNALVIWKSGTGSRGHKMRLATIACNVVLLGFICWAFVDQYPHPDEQGLLAFEIVMVSVPIISVTMLLRAEAIARSRPEPVS